MNAADPARKKQLGQYFTGVPVARLLLALADVKDAATLIDPMVGVGDMLQAAIEVGSTGASMVGIDLDPLAVKVATDRFAGRPSMELRCQDAFSGPLPTHQFAMVVTNPPYIRYQGRSDVDGVETPTTPTVRRGLIAAIEARADLSAAAKHLFIETARSYPATADVAVPAWILAASLVAEDGTLAVVVPQAWLSRNYAAPLRSMLERSFDVTHLVEDGDASWFDDAQVRTHLLVARRRPVDAPPAHPTTVVARATGALNDGGYLRGGFSDEKELVAALNAVTSPHNVFVTAGLVARREVRSATAAGTTAEVAGLLSAHEAEMPGRTLESYGWQAGQGMRTGANDFFYVSRSGHTVTTSARWTTRHVSLPMETLLPTVRRQADLDDRLLVDRNGLTSALANLRGWATRADREAAAREGWDKDWWNSRYRLLPDDVCEWIQEAEASVTRTPPHRRLPELTAVAPNQKVGRSGEPLGYWYQLPPLARRHQPDLFIPRVCGGRPYARASSDGVVVDANFATLWAVTDNALPAPAVLALLNSTWVWANLEQNCTVLGGGALKVEATDLRRLRLPDFDDLAVAELTRLGKALSKTTDTDVLAEVDWTVASALSRPDRADGLASALGEMATRGLEHRS